MRPVERFRLGIGRFGGVGARHDQQGEAAQRHREDEALPGDVQPWTHTCDAIWCPDIDRSLERPASKTAFWQAFRSLGEWYADKPPF